MDIKDYLRVMIEKGASDLYFITGASPSMKINGDVTSMGDKTMAPGVIHTLACGLMRDDQIESFKHHPECNISLSETGIGRFRVNIYKQRGETAMVLRHIKTKIPSVEECGLPPILSQLIMKKHGLILFVGATGAGKSTSLASLIDHRNQHSAGHIISVEGPIEFVHHHKKSIITQREVGVDTDSYHDALKNMLRQSPDMIIIGEVRDRETMKHALEFCQTGHLCVSTLHATNANQAMERISHFFPEDARDQLLLDLSLNLVAVISQRLVPSVDGGRVPAIEILLGTSLVRDLIRRNEISALKDVMKKSDNLGMQTIDGALQKLYEAGKITKKDALDNADSPNNLRLEISLVERAKHMRSSEINSNKPPMPSEHKNNFWDCNELGGSGLSIEE